MGEGKPPPVASQQSEGMLNGVGRGEVLASGDQGSSWWVGRHADNPVGTAFAAQAVVVAVAGC
ncbi:hypothetical protein, partial [Nocardia puris]|uniref:hypothetical protein n=1 Tax=Nocardia puris TaxID=208602 RepID=UPI001E570C5B